VLQRLVGDGTRLERLACIGVVFGVPLPPLPPTESSERSTDEIKELS
jgi:hypothetical protein